MALRPVVKALIQILGKLTIDPGTPIYYFHFGVHLLDCVIVMVLDDLSNKGEVLSLAVCNFVTHLLVFYYACYVYIAVSGLSQTNN